MTSAVKVLLDAGVPIEAVDEVESTALVSAASEGHVDIVRLLLDKRADIEASYNGETALVCAAYWGHSDVIRLLLHKGANIEANYSGGTALCWAAGRGHSDIVRLLLDKGANIEAKIIDEISALHNAARCNNLEMVEILLGRGADPYARDGYKRRPLEWARKNGNKEIMKRLEKEMSLTRYLRHL